MESSVSIDLDLALLLIQECKEQAERTACLATCQKWITFRCALEAAIKERGAE